ncbi:MAG: antibiotic biosynthesis monooxygenase [Chloroflexota bacterium]
MSDENIIWIAEATIRDGKRAEFEGVMKDLVAATSKEEGALHYEWYISEDGKEVYIYERYKDLEAAITHLSTWEPNADRFIAAAEFNLLTVLSDLPPDLRERLSGLNTAYRVPFGGFKK